MSIDPNNVTKFDRTRNELLEFWLFCLFVRGKNADVQTVKLDEFIKQMHGLPKMPEMVGMIEFKLRQVKAGQYGTLTPAIRETLIQLEKDPDFLRRASARDLEDIYGVGPKTSRFFILHSRPDARVAVLDTHILRYLGDRSGVDIPRLTPPAGKRYEKLEEDFLMYADLYEVDPAAFDLAIWRASRETYPMDWHRYYTEVS